MALTALRGGVGFLTRFPAGGGEAGWHAFRRRPFVLPVVGYGVGAAVAAPVAAAAALALPSLAAATVAAGWLYAVTGLNHLDGLADAGDALAATGDADERVAAMRDASLGAGGALALVLVVLGLVAALDSLAAASLHVAAAVVVAAEVGAKAAMALVACLGDARHDGLGSAIAEPAEHRDLPVVAAVALPAGVLAWPSPAAAAALAAAVLAGGATAVRVAGAVGGVSGDVFGAVNEVGRVAGLHAGVIAWTLS